MPEYLAPGVFVEEVPFRGRPIEGVPTSTTGFIGATRFGPVALPPGLLTSLEDFERVYDPVDPGAALDFSDASDAPNFQWHAVRAFFAEGGKRLYVARVFHRLDDGDVVPMDDCADLAVTAAADRHGDGHARVDPAATPGLRVRARHPGACANLRVAFALQGSANRLVRAEGPVCGSTGNTLRAVHDLDLVWVRRASCPSSTPGTGQLCLAHCSEAGRSWELEPLDSGLPAAATRYSIDTLHVDDNDAGRGDAVHRVTLSVSLLTRDGSRELGRWDGLPLDPRHRLGDQADSVFARFGNSPALATDAHSLPLVLVRDPALAATAFDVVTALFGADPLAVLVPGDDDARRGITAADKLASGAISAAFVLDGGNDGQRPTAADFEGHANPCLGFARGLKQFEDLDDIALVAAPGATWKYSDNRSEPDKTIDHLITHAERLRYRVALLDSGDTMSIHEIRNLRDRLDSRHAALYHPWVTVMDPLSQRPLNLPPSGFVAGICARSDTQRGVHQAPANEVLRLAIGLEVQLDKAEQDLLRSEGINGFRSFEGRGLRLWGARTISADPEWRYLNVRRYVAYLEHSIDKGIQWAVFEPNGDALWAQVRRTIEDFLLQEWQRGALLGDKPERAYFVRCDRTTMTQDDLDNGRLICLIGVAPLKPAEFVLFRIGQWTADRCS